MEQKQLLLATVWMLVIADSLMDKMMRKIARIYQSLFGNKTLLPLERLCLNAWAESLPTETRITLDKQLLQLQFVQRQAAGAKVCFFFNSQCRMPLFENSEPNLHVATITLKFGDQPMKVRIFVHRGVLFSIEFAKSPDHFFRKHLIAQPSPHIESVVTKYYWNS